MSKYYDSPRWSYEVLDCSLPVTFDQHSNCSFGCIYCFSSFTRSIGTSKINYLMKVAHPVNVEKVKRIFSLEEESQFSEHIKAGKSLQWGGLSDPFCNYEKKMGTAKELLKYFQESGKEVSFSTKGVWWLDDPEYTQYFKGNKKFHVKVSIINYRHEHSRIIEPGVPSPKERLEGIRKLADLGIGGVTLRLRPYLIGVSCLDLDKLIKEAADNGADSISTEFFCAERRNPILAQNIKKISKIVGFDYMQFYIQNSNRSGYLRLNRHLKLPYIERIKDLAEKNGLKLFVSDAHIKDYGEGGSCCGLNSSFNYSKCQFTQAVMIAKDKGEVSFSDINKGVDYMKNQPLSSARGYNQGSSGKRIKYGKMSIYQFIRHMWNNPNEGKSPYTEFEGTLVPDRVDDNGDVVYKYNKGNDKK